MPRLRRPSNANRRVARGEVVLDRQPARGGLCHFRETIHNREGSEIRLPGRQEFPAVVGCSG